MKKITLLAVLVSANVMAKGGFMLEGGYTSLTDDSYAPYSNTNSYSLGASITTDGGTVWGFMYSPEVGSDIDHLDYYGGSADTFSPYVGYLTDSGIQWTVGATFSGDKFNDDDFNTSWNASLGLFLTDNIYTGIRYEDLDYGKNLIYSVGLKWGFEEDSSDYYYTPSTYSRPNQVEQSGASGIVDGYEAPDWAKRTDNDVDDVYGNPREQSKPKRKELTQDEAKKLLDKQKKEEEKQRKLEEEKEKERQAKIRCNALEEEINIHNEYSTNRTKLRNIRVAAACEMNTVYADVTVFEMSKFLSSRKAQRNVMRDSVDVACKVVERESDKFGVKNIRVRLFDEKKSIEQVAETGATKEFDSYDYKLVSCEQEELEFNLDFAPQ